MDYLRKVIDRHHGVNFCALPPAAQAEYLGALAQRGAADVLKALGLHDEEAAADIRDIRDLLRGLRLMKRTAWTVTVTALGRMAGWVFVLVLAALFLNSRQARELAGLIVP
ncbi:MAG: hypothetical protein P4M15_13475 [Alphaproteobacteria bacterium]|nr:hypothetical protein [Alphaproteobacteria bacterium]